VSRDFWHVLHQVGIPTQVTRSKITYNEVEFKWKPPFRGLPVSWFPLLQPLTTTRNRIFGSVYRSVSPWSISVLLGFDPIPVMHSTKCKSFTCELADGMSVPGVEGVEVLVSCHVGHGVLETLHRIWPHLGWQDVFHIAYYHVPCQTGWAFWAVESRVSFLCERETTRSDGVTGLF
jgi:hypothetical protein